jgi:hypothetical protein
MSNSKTLCMLPWLHRFTNEQGFHLVCASGNDPVNRLRGEDGRPLHVSQGLTDNEVLNSPDLKATRRTMMKGEWPDACQRCRRAEEAGATSARLHMMKRFGSWSESELGRTAGDGTLDRPQVRYADIRLGNACNLTCRMCGPSASRLWANHFNEVQPREYLVPVADLTDMRDNNWVKARPVGWLMEQCLPSVESMHFAGGEPLIVPELVEALDLCVQSGRAHEIDLSFNTNLTVLPAKVTNLWPHFRSVSILASVDGFGRLNDYIRRPSKWADIDRNLHQLDTHYKEWKLRYIRCSVTVQMYNILQLGELYGYLRDGFEYLAPVPQLAPLYFPAYLSIQNLPDRAKQVARERLLAECERAVTAPRPSPASLLSSIDTVLAYMSGPGSRRELMNFLYFSEKTDRRLGGSWREACPELARLMGTQELVVKGQQPAIYQAGPKAEVDGQ